MFPVSFEATSKKILRLLYHVLAHLYHAHFKEIILLQLHPHLNTLLQHTVVFCKRFSLVEEKELEVLDDLYQRLVTFTGASSDSHNLHGEGSPRLKGKNGVASGVPHSLSDNAVSGSPLPPRQTPLVCDTGPHPTVVAAVPTVRSATSVSS